MHKSEEESLKIKKLIFIIAVGYQIQHQVKNKPKSPQLKITSIPKFYILKCKAVWWIRLSGVLAVSTSKQVYEWKHARATQANWVAPSLLPGLFMESLWPVEKI